MLFSALWNPLPPPCSLTEKGSQYNAKMTPPLTKGASLSPSSPSSPLNISSSLWGNHIDGTITHVNDQTGRPMSDNCHFDAHAVDTSSSVEMKTEDTAIMADKSILIDYNNTDDAADADGKVSEQHWIKLENTDLSQLPDGYQRTNHNRDDLTGNIQGDSLRQNAILFEQETIEDLIILAARVIGKQKQMNTGASVPERPSPRSRIQIQHKRKALYRDTLHTSHMVDVASTTSSIIQDGFNHAHGSNHSNDTQILQPHTPNDLNRPPFSIMSEAGSAHPERSASPSQSARYTSSSVLEDLPIAPQYHLHEFLKQTTLSSPDFNSIVSNNSSHKQEEKLYDFQNLLGHTLFPISVESAGEEETYELLDVQTPQESSRSRNIKKSNSPGPFRESQPSRTNIKKRQLETVPHQVNGRTVKVLCNKYVLKLIIPKPAQFYPCNDSSYVSKYSAIIFL